MDVLDIERVDSGGFKNADDVLTHNEFVVDGLQKFYELNFIHVGSSVRGFELLHFLAPCLLPRTEHPDIAHLKDSRRIREECDEVDVFFATPFDEVKAVMTFVAIEEPENSVLRITDDSFLVEVGKEDVFGVIFEAFLRLIARIGLANCIIRRCLEFCGDPS